ncbi:MAG: class I SAM-dependent methyltransferase [Pseudomonadota bacterium]
MTQQAPYKPDRFDQAVDHYVSARSRYAPALINWLADDTRIAGKAVLDLGCGPGFLANALAPKAGAALGLDPSPNMIAAARIDAAPNARFEIGSSEDLSHVEAPVQLVTMGRAFHWMDRAQTLKELEPLLAQDGTIALINDSVAKIPMNAWWHAFQAVGKRYAVMDDYNQHRASEAWVPHEQVLAASAFSDLRRISVFQQHSWTFERLIRHTYSRSATTEALLGEQMPAFEDEAREVLAPFGPAPWVSLNEHKALLARRPHAADT